MTRAIIILTLLMGLGGYRIQAIQATQTGGPEAEVPEPYRASTDWLPGVATLTTRAAEHYMGAPYRWGGETPAGFDCSGFVQYVYALNGIELPRLSREQAMVGRAIEPELSELRKGDLVFFASADAIDHVGIYAGDATIIHASLGRGAVGTDRLDRRDGWYAQRLVAARRVIDRR